MHPSLLRIRDWRKRNLLNFPSSKFSVKNDFSTDSMATFSGSSAKSISDEFFPYQLHAPEDFKLQRNKLFSTAPRSVIEFSILCRNFIRMTPRDEKEHKFQLEAVACSEFFPEKFPLKPHFVCIWGAFVLYSNFVRRIH